MRFAMLKHNRIQKDTKSSVIPCISTGERTKTIMLTDNKLCKKALGNNPMVGATVACAVAVEEAMK